MAQVSASAESPDSPDWKLIQSLYLQGQTPKQIEAITGVPKQSISLRASRLGWTETLRKARPIVKVSIETAKEKPENNLSKHSEAVRAGLADVLKRSVEKIQALTLKTPKAALKANAELESVVRNCKTVFGWSDSSNSPIVRIAILGDATIQSEPTPQPVIDVESKSQTDS